MPVSPFEEEATEISNPIKRIRWATRKLTSKDAGKKRRSLLGRNQSEKRRSKRSSAGEASEPELDKEDTTAADEPETEDSGRRIFFNTPLPADARDENGHPINHYARNKIRTAKYTPISFVPKNLWFQFHNIANIYFLFIIILSVCCLHVQIGWFRVLTYSSFSPFLEQRTLVWAPYH
jgi:phospholipid-translocating ATPase